MFQRILDEERIERVPVLEVLKRQPKQIILTALLRMPEQAPGYIVGAWIFTYATGAGLFARLRAARRHLADRARVHVGGLSPAICRTSSAARTCT